MALQRQTNFVFQWTRVNTLRRLFWQHKAGEAQLATWPESRRSKGFLNSSARSWQLMRVRITPFAVIQNRGPEPPHKRLDLNQQHPQLDTIKIEAQQKAYILMVFLAESNALVNFVYSILAEKQSKL